jgi:hypothetical protein
MYRRGGRLVQEQRATRTQGLVDGVQWGPDQLLRERVERLREQTE